MDFSSISIILLGSTFGLILRIFIQNKFKKSILFDIQNTSIVNFLASFLLGILVAQDSFEDFKRKEAMAFEDLRNSIESDYNNFVLKEKRDFQDFKKNVEEKWMNFKYTTSTSYVSYDEDLKSRSIIDFDLGKVTVEIILEDKEDDESLNFEFDTKNKTRFGHFFQNFPKNNVLLISTGFLFYNQNADFINDEFSRNNTKPIFQKLVYKIRVCPLTAMAGHQQIAAVASKFIRVLPLTQSGRCKKVRALMRHATLSLT